jgi:hypothetical protein
VALTIAEREKIRHHLGYSGTAVASVLSVGGIPSSYPLSWALEGAMNRLMIESEPRVRDLLVKLDQTEEQIFCAQAELGAVQVGNITPNLKQREDLMRAYKYWQASLATTFLTVPNPYDLRFTGVGAGAGNVGVDHG